MSMKPKTKKYPYFHLSSGMCLEIHPVDAGDERQGDEDRRDDRQNLHDLVHPVGHARQVRLQHAGQDVPICFGVVDDLDDVVVDVAEKDIRRRLDKGGFLPFDPGYDFPQRPDRLPEEKHLPLQGMDGVERFLAGILDKLLFELIDPVSDVLQDDEIMIHDRIQKGVGQVVRPKLPDAGLAAPDSFPDRVEHIARLLLEGQDEIFPENQAQLLGHDLGPLAIELDHPGNDIKGIVQLVQLGPLGRGHDVFKNQGVEAERFSDLLDGFGVVDAVDVDPGHRRGLVKGEALFDGLDDFFVEMLAVVIHDRDTGAVDLAAAHVNEATRGKPGFLGSRIRIPAHPIPPPLSSGRSAHPPGKAPVSDRGARASFPQLSAPAFLRKRERPP